MKLSVLVIAIVVSEGLCNPLGVLSGTEHPLIPCAPSISANCPAYDGPYPVYIADPVDCTKFCICSHGSAYEESCMPGLVWDTVNTSCNWPIMVDCGSRPIPISQ